MSETWKPGPKLDFQRLIREMATRPELAKEVLAEPTKFQERYQLSPKVVEVLSQMRLEDFQGPLEDDELAAVAGGYQQDQLEDGCYYGG